MYRHLVFKAGSRNYLGMVDRAQEFQAGEWIKHEDGRVFQVVSVLMAGDAANPLRLLEVAEINLMEDIRLFPASV